MLVNTLNSGWLRFLVLFFPSLALGAAFPIRILEYALQRVSTRTTTCGAPSSQIKFEISFLADQSITMPLICL